MTSPSSTCSRSRTAALSRSCSRIPAAQDPARRAPGHRGLLPLTGTPLAPVFDTQQAAALLGFPAQIGYAELVRQLLGVELAKGHARTDWSRAGRCRRNSSLTQPTMSSTCPRSRRLPLGERLEVTGRRAWFDEESAALRDIALYRVEPAEAWRRLKGLERFDDAAFATARPRRGLARAARDGS